MIKPSHITFILSFSSNRKTSRGVLRFLWFAQHERSLTEKRKDGLLESSSQLGRYRPNPVHCVEIPKDNGKGVPLHFDSDARVI